MCSSSGNYSVALHLSRDAWLEFGQVVSESMPMRDLVEAADERVYPQSVLYLWHAGCWSADSPYLAGAAEVLAALKRIWEFKYKFIKVGALPADRLVFGNYSRSVHVSPYYDKHSGEHYVYVGPYGVD